ncbi:alpha/beta hydrolase [Thalassotalea fonticola]|uniref:Alpha/beta hydrolase n=1 Tax=Thalassotalea fonticola TaxID=3065649 RepID=A0ABZ0GKH7_9GAMM|nr:alpha/beta hydrolase [Colwelliaceae bacterium S1-1]
MREKLHLIPGTMCNEQLWSLLIPYLHSSFELIYLDIPREKSFDEIAEHYNNILGSEKLNLIGFSLGGYIATYFSLKYPERINKLFIISNSPTSLPSDELQQRDDILKWVNKYGYKGIGRNKVVNLFDVINQTDELVDLVLNMDKELGEEEFVSQYQYTSQRADLSLALSQAPFKTHFYYSECDRLVNAPLFNELRDCSANLSVICTSGSGHMLPLEKPQELADYIISWAG